QRRLLAVAGDEEVAAGHSLRRAEQVLADELAVHDRQPPEAAVAELLALLERVAEEAQAAPQADRPRLVDRQSVVAGGRRAGEDALADAVDQRLLQGIAREGEEQQADPR